MVSFLSRHRHSLTIFALLLIGCALRLVWGNDIEYKADEAYSFARVQNVGTSEPWPWVGMNSSVGLVNPGMAVWVFLGLGKLFSVQTPPDLARSVALMNCAALFVLALMILWEIPREEKRAWTWALALAAVNPIGVLLQRKIWSPSTLPLLSIVMLWGWFKRDRWAGAFTWGLIGAFLGQIHMGGFFYMAGLAGWTFLFDRTKRTRWLAWSTGTFVGLLPLLPWVVAMLHASSSGEHSVFKIARIFTFKFYNYWVSGAFGVNLTYSLGSDFWTFLKFPLVAGYPTLLMGLVEVFLCFSLLWTLFKLGNRWKQKSWKLKELIESENQTSLLVGASLWGTGLLMTIALVPVHNHYMVVFFPLMGLWLANAWLRFGRSGERMLTAIFLAQLFLSSGFLYYIHTQGGSARGDYGVSYSEQMSRAKR